MSKRSERRAAERAAHKANRKTTTITTVDPATVPAFIEPTPTAEADVLLTGVYARCEDSQAKPIRRLDLLTTPAETTTQTNIQTTATVAGNGDFLADFNTAQEPTFQVGNPIQPDSSAASDAQIRANRQNSQKSTGPTSALGRQIVSQNRRSHGLLGQFQLHLGESPEDYAQLVEEVQEEYNPQTPTESRLAISLIQHYWLMQRAIRLQAEVLGDDDKKLSLYMRYHATHERSYYKAQKELKASMKERNKIEIGFEQQKQKSELTEALTRLVHAKAQHIEIDTACRQIMDAPIPGHKRIGFEQLTKACSDAIATLLIQTERKAAA